MCFVLFFVSFCEPFIHTLPVPLSVAKLDAPPPPQRPNSHSQGSHMLLLCLSAVTVSVAGLGNNVQRAPLSCCELFSQRDTRLRSYVNWNYELRNAACFKKGKWVMSSAVCFETKSQVRRWGLLSKKKNAGRAVVVLHQLYLLHFLSAVNQTHISLHQWICLGLNLLMV